MNTTMKITIPGNFSDAMIQYGSDQDMRSKNVSLDDLISSLATGHQISTGILPSGAKLYSGSSSAYSLWIEVPAKVRPLETPGNDRRDRSTYLVPFPRMLFKFQVTSMNIVDTRAFCLKNPFESNDDIVYRFPYGNTYADGRVCWGGVRTPRITSPIQLASLITMFFQSEFNGDLLDPRTVMDIGNGGDGMPALSSIINDVAYKESFNNDHLFRCDISIREILTSQG